MKRLLPLLLLALASAACADILGLDELGPVVRTGDDEQEPLPDAGSADATDQ